MRGFFKGEPNAKLAGALTLPPPALTPHKQAKAFWADDGLREAVNVSLFLGQPLLVTGEPGAGKTQLAHAIANEFDLELIEANVSSATTAQDLFYRFDDLARFRDVNAGAPRPLQSYLTFTGLGLAILLAGGPMGRLSALPTNLYAALGETPPKRFEDLFVEAYPVEGPTRSVVLIDELDKAPRDTPNDMLAAIERMSFEITELGVRVEPDAAPDAVRPIVVITSNSEKSLPDAFLRRCVYHNIEFPSLDVLREIIRARIGGDAGKLGESALVVLGRLRDPATALRRPPATAEFIAWIVLLVDRLETPRETDLTEAPELIRRTLGALVKTREDTIAATAMLTSWLGE